MSNKEGETQTLTTNGAVLSKNMGKTAWFILICYVYKGEPDPGFSVMIK